MKNIIVCNNCHEENPFYEKTCWKCHSYLRDKVYNIDLWKAISRITESPREAFKAIILSEHKNFIVPVIIFAAIKFLLDSFFLSFIDKSLTSEYKNIFIGFLVVLGLTTLILAAFSFLLKVFTASTEAKTRFKDNLAILTYSFIPHTIGLCILFPIEVVVFGSYLFSVNPSPFIIKETLAYVMAGFEILLVLWGLFLAIIAVFVQTRSTMFSVIFGIVFYIAIFYSLYLLRIFI